MTSIIFGTVVVAIVSVIPLWFEEFNAGTIVILIVIGLTVWLVLAIYLRTYYSVHDDVVRIVSGPFRWKVKISEITSIQSTKSILSSPALSMDRLEIKYGRWGSVVISPEDKQRFANELIKRNSAIKVTL
ncbi:PH domain-containing protein [Bacillus sp. FJAT-45066]|uniref:PH domain-containing protein n=1 Tax=Bacillus sp. FJAT-45066 TaxID=2011010 RepID=UPI000BB7E03A|nr:PH domain-containing protein [Bacillus sp. FJAT-45066]